MPEISLADKSVDRAKKSMRQLDKPGTLIDLIDHFSQPRDADALVAFQKDHKQVLSYKDLLDQIQLRATSLKKQGLKEHNAVIFLSANSINFVVTAFSVIYAGGVLVPVDGQSNDETLQHIVKDCNAKMIFADTNGVERLEQLKLDSQFEVHNLEKLRTLDHADAGNNLSANVHGDDPAVIFYTSGTSGLPKAVPLTHTNLMVQVESVLKTGLVQKSDRVLLPLPFFHVYPFVIGLLSPLALGLTIVMPRSMTGPEIIRAVKEGETTILVAVPRLLRALYTAIESKVRAYKYTSVIFDCFRSISTAIYCSTGLAVGKVLFKAIHRQFPKLEMLACGGALLEPDLAANLKALGWRIALGYGLTETSPLLSIRMPNNNDLMSVGKPIPGVEVRIQEVKDDGSDATSSSEIQARGKSIFKGYLNLPEKTQEAFTEDGWFKTGDIGCLKRGNLYVTGRISSMLKSEGGKKIQPDQIEKIFEKEAAIREIGVLQDDGKLVALVVPDLRTTGSDNLHKQIHDIIQRRSSALPSYYRINDFAITKEPLPKTNLGKIRRQELIARYKQSKTKPGEQPHTTSLEDLSPGDRALLKEPLAKQCWDWLEERFPDSQINFDSSPQVDLNVDSMEWINLTFEISERLGVTLDENAIARVDTVRDLLNEVVDAGQIGAGKTSPFEKPEAMLSEDERKWLEPLSPAMVVFSYWLYIVNFWVMRVCFRISAKGLDNLPKKQVVFIPNHLSYIDPSSLAAVLDFATLRHTQWAGWAGIFLANPVNTFIYRLAQAIPIESKRSLMSSLALGAAVLKEKKNLIWFPEGERSLTGKLLPFRSGIGMLLSHFAVEIVPVYLHGTREALPPGKFFPRLKKITVVFGEPISSAKLAKDTNGSPEAMAEALHDRVKELSKTVNK